MTGPRELRVAIEQLNQIHYGILWRTPRCLVGMFEDLSRHYYSRFNDPEMADKLIQAGRQAIENEDWMRLQEVNVSLLRLLPAEDRRRFPGQTGITIEN